MGGKQSIGVGSKPRLVRQQAVQEESTELSCSPPRLGVRFLPTIPSAADSSVILDEESHHETAVAAIGSSVAPVVVSSCSTSVATSVVSVPAGIGAPFYTVLQSGNTLTTLSSPKNKHKPP